MFLLQISLICILH